jgi:hypothetical protein
MGLRAARQGQSDEAKKIKVVLSEIDDELAEALQQAIEPKKAQ